MPCETHGGAAVCPCPPELRLAEHEVSNHTGEAFPADLVERIRNSDSSAMEELYRVCPKRFRSFLARQVDRQDLDDMMQDLFMAAVEGIQKGAVRDPARLMGYMFGIARRLVADHISARAQARRDRAELTDWLPVFVDPLAEGSLIVEESAELAVGILGGLRDREREVLIRFYLHGQTPEQIRREMNLTPDQVYSIKKRAKARLAEMMTRATKRRSWSEAAA